MDPYGWKWVLKKPQLPPNIPTISCRCKLCQNTSNQYNNRRNEVQKLSNQIDDYLKSIKSPNVSDDDDDDDDDDDINNNNNNNNVSISEPKIIETCPIDKKAINVIIKTKYGRVLTEFKPKKKQYFKENKKCIPYKIISNDGNSTTNDDNCLQPPMINIIEKIAIQRLKHKRTGAGSMNDNTEIIEDIPQSIYDINNDNDNNNNNNNNQPIKLSGKKRKRSDNNNNNNNPSKRRRKNSDLHTNIDKYKLPQNQQMKLDSFRVLDNDTDLDLNNDITQLIYDNTIKLYSIMRMNDDRKHMIRTKLRSSVELPESILLNKLHSEVVSHGMRHVCIWQEIRRHFINGFSDKCGIFDQPKYIQSPRHSHRNSTIKKDDLDEDDVSVCCVCFDGTFIDKNPIIFCDQCNIGVHRYCYGIKKIPNQHTEWLCVPCKYIKYNNNNTTIQTPQCCLCPIKGGALKKTKEGGFAHITCAIWINGIEIADIKSMSPILNISQTINEQQQQLNKINNNDTYLSLFEPENMSSSSPTTRSQLKKNKNKYKYTYKSKSRSKSKSKNKNKNKNQNQKENNCELLFSLSSISINSYLNNNNNCSYCAICKLSSGCFIKCSYEGCNDLYHVFCAWFNGQYMRITPKIYDGGLEHEMFCIKHTPNEIGGIYRNFNKYRLLRYQGLTENNLTALIHKRERILNIYYENYSDLNSIRDTYLPQKCCICFIDNNINKLIKCNNCAIQVHINCYGISSSFDSTNWYCDPCSCSPQYAKAVHIKGDDINTQIMSNSNTPNATITSSPVSSSIHALRSRSHSSNNNNNNNRSLSVTLSHIVPNIKSVSCVLCPRLGGALKYVDNKYWIHIVCALWIPSININKNNHKISGVNKLLNKIKYKKSKNKTVNQCYLCNKSRGVPIKCFNNECDLYFHVTCCLFSGSHFKLNSKEIFCRKHSPILNKINGGNIHYLHQYIELLKLSEIYDKIYYILYILQQKQFRNKELIREIFQNIKNKLPNININKQSTPSTPSHQLIINDDDNDDNDNDIDSDIDIFEENVLNPWEYIAGGIYNKTNSNNNNNTKICIPRYKLPKNNKYFIKKISKKNQKNQKNEQNKRIKSQYLNYNKKYKYQTIINNAYQKLINIINNNDNDNDKNNNNNNSIPSINELPNYLNDAIDSINDIYSNFRNKSLNGNPSYFDNNFDTKHFLNGDNVNKLLSTSNYINKHKLEYFNNNNNDNDIDLNPINLNLDENIKSFELHKKLNKIDQIFFKKRIEKSLLFDENKEENNSKNNDNNIFMNGYHIDSDFDYNDYDDYDYDDDNNNNKKKKKKKKKKKNKIYTSTSAQKIKKCDLCGRYREKWSISCWVKHLNNKHIHICNYCPYRTTKPGYLIRHKQREH